MGFITLAKGAYGEMRSNSGASNGDERCFTDYLVLPGGHCEVCTLNTIGSNSIWRFILILWLIEFIMFFIFNEREIVWNKTMIYLKIVKLFYSLIEYLLWSEYRL